jgi:hypothetical protein
MIRTNKLPLLVLLAASTAGVVATAGRADERVLERESSRQSFELTAGTPARLAIDNYFGRVEIRTHDAARIDLELTRTVRGRSREKLEQAQREVHLDVTAEPDGLDLYVDAPYRRNRWRQRHWGWQDRGYRVIYDFVLTVPPRIDLEIKNVSDGHVRINGTRGRFDVANVNGRVEMRDVGGSGSAETVNGGVLVEFRHNPTEASSFATVNGDVEVHFIGDLQADLWMHSSFGELWSEFDSRPLAAMPATESVEDGRRVIRTDPGARVRVGDGGPSHSFKTLTGDVLIRRERKERNR